MCACLCVRMYEWLYALAPERPKLPQLSTLALALKSDGPLLPGCPWTPCSPAHCSLEPRTLQMIYYPHRERERSAPNLSSPRSLSILLPFISLHSLNPACQPYYFLSPSKRKIHFQSSVLPLHLIVDSPFVLEFFLLISVAYPSFFCLLQLENTRIAFS